MPGRRTILDEDLCHRLCELLKAGHSQAKCAAAVGCHTTTLQGWLKEGRRPECADPLKRRLAIAWQLSKWHLLGRVIKGDKRERIVEDGDGNILTRTTETHQKTETAQWLLKIRFPAEFGEVAVDDEVDTSRSIGADEKREAKPSRASLEKLAEQIIKAKNGDDI